MLEMLLLPLGICRAPTLSMSWRVDVRPRPQHMRLQSGPLSLIEYRGTLLLLPTKYEYSPKNSPLHILRMLITFKDLLLLEEVNGPAPSSRGVGYRVSNQELNVSVGPIELLRRRTTKEGKAKLKLTLVGLRVERCGICLTQFKSGEHGALTDCCHR